MVGMYEMQKFMPKTNCYHWLAYRTQFADDNTEVYTKN